MSNELDQLAESFRRFPGIGPRQAKRFVHYLLHAPKSEIENLLTQIRELKASAKQCPTCFRFSADVCAICNNPGRDHSLLMLVEKDIDLENIEKSDTFKGYYFVLGGLVPILEKNPEQSIRAPELLKTIKAKPELKEIIIAVSANAEGDHTVEFLKQFLVSSLERGAFKISTLGRGLSTGAELEYSDSDTLKNALKHRE